MNDPTMREQAMAFNDNWHAIDKLYEAYAKSVGLTYMSFLVLDIIGTTPEGCTQKLICDQTLLPKQSVNTIIKSFLDRGIIKLKELAADRRNKEIRLSKKGKAYTDKLLHPIWDAEEKALGSIPHEQRQMLVDLTKQFELSMRMQLQSLTDKG